VEPKRVTRKLRAILSADVQGYSRLMGDDEVATVKTITEYREIFSSIVAQHNGRVVDSPGDNILSEFASVVDAVQCAVEIQKVLKAKNEELPENRRMIFRIGVNLGDVIHEDDRIYGDGVNIAARIESLADGGGICISGSAYEQIENKLALGYNFIGEHSVKNIAKPIRVYKVPMAPGDVGIENAGKSWKKVAITAAVLFILGITAFAVWNFYWRTPQVEPASVEKMAFSLPDKPSIAVLPFDNMSGDPKQDYLCDGISEQIIASLSQVPGIFVIARNSSFIFKGKSVKVQQVSEELGVRYVLEGSLQKSGDRLRITVQLIDAITGNHIWAEKFDRQLKDLFALQDEITMHILTALRVNLTEGEQARNFGAGTKNIEAYMKAMKGLKLYQSRTREGTLKGIQLFEEAIALDPGYVNAYVLLSWAHLQNAVAGFTKAPAESWKEAFKLAQTALSMNNADANAHALMGFLLVFLKNKPEEAIAEAEKAVALAPNRADIIALFGTTLSHAGRYGEAVSKFKEAIRQNPFPPDWYVKNLIKTYRMSGQHDAEAFSTIEWALNRDPDNFKALAQYSWNLGLSGRYSEAIETSRKAIRKNPKHPFVYQAYLGLNLFLAERYEEAIAPLKESISKAPNTPWGNLGLIATYVQLGRNDDAFKVTKKFVNGKPAFSAKKWLDINSFKNAGDRERFAEAFRKVGLMEKKPGSEISEKSALPLPDKPSIAVLPFANISGNPKEDYLSDGITEQIITALSKTPKLFVIARNSVFTYKGKPVKVQQVSRDLGVRYVLEGSVQKSGDKVRITAQLIDATTGEHVWAERYDRELRDIFALQDEITMQILTALRVKLTDGEQLLIYGGGTTNLESYTKFLQGLYRVHRNEKGTYHAAIKKFEEVISLDPQYPAPYFWLAWAQRWVFVFDRSVDPGQSLAKAMSTVKKGIALDDSNAFAIVVLSMIYQAQGQHEKSVSTAEEAVALEPNMAEAHVWLGVSLHYVGRYDEAINQLNMGIRLNPIPPGYYNMFLGNAYQLAGMYEESIAAYKKAILFSPNHLFPHMRLAVTYSLMGREKDARDEAAEVLRINPKFSAEHFMKVVPYKSKAVKDLLLEGMHKAGLK